jgi:ribonuclease HII
VERLIGIDEAGRGPVLGPLVMAAVSITTEQEDELRSFGIQDSKKYGSGKKAKTARLAARPNILSRCEYRVVVYEPEEIDRYVNQGRLDELEREGAERLLKEIGATSVDRIICDGEPIFGRLSFRWPKLVAENKADVKHLCVSAASILAKVARDEAMDLILRKYEAEFGKITGGGYVNVGTRKFMEAYEAKYGTLPPEARKSWTWREKPKFVNGPSIADMLNGT